MVTIYQCTIFISVTLLAIIVAIFVFAVSIYKPASELTTKEEEKSLNKRKEIIKETRQGLTKKINRVKDEHLSSELKIELDKLDKELNDVDKSILKSREQVKKLTLWNMVGIPASFLLISIIASGIAIVGSGILETIMRIVSFMSIAISLYYIYRNLFTIEFFSKLIDLSTLMEQALERHERKTRPTLELDIKDYNLVIKRGDTQEVEGLVFLTQGLTAKNVKIRFLGTEELDFPEEEIEQFDFDKENMKKPKVLIRKIGILNYGVYHVVRFKVKVPNAKGEYTMSYWLRCDDFTGEEKFFKIKVI